MSNTKNEIVYVYSTESYLHKRTMHKLTGDEEYDPWFKIGETTQTADERIAQQDGTSSPEKHIKLYELDLIEKGYDITAYELEQKIHRYYDRLGLRVRNNREWFEAGSVVEIKKVIESILNDSDLHKPQILLRPHQEEAIEKINQCFLSSSKKCLLNHKPRSGKTYISIEHIKRNRYKNTIILTSFPIINYQWEETILDHSGFLNYNVITSSGISEINLDSEKNNILLISLQDAKGGKEIFSKEKFINIKDIEWDLMIIDEVHFGVETEKTKYLIDIIKHKRLLGLSATPTKNLICGTFDKDQIHTYSLVEENKLKKEIPSLYPYANINFYLWNLTESERKDLKYFTDEEQFTFEKFFRIENNEFYYKNDIIHFFKKLIGSEDICKDKLGTEYPFKNNRLFGCVKSILLFVPEIKVEEKLKQLLDSIDIFSENFNIHITNSNINSSKELMRKIKKDFKSKTDKRSLIIAVDQLTTGITLEDCDMVAFMNDWKSVDKYVQASFRCQSPREGKENCFVVDFNAARSFEMIWEYNNILSKNNNKGLEQTLREWIECVNIFNRVDGGLEKIDFNSFNSEYNRIISEKPRFNYSSVIFEDKLKDESIRKALSVIGIGGSNNSTEKDLNEDGINSGKSKKNNKNKSNPIIGLSDSKVLEIAKALIDKTMLLTIFTGFKYDKVDDCFKDLDNNVIIPGIGYSCKQMFLETLLLGINEVDKIDLIIIKYIYDNIYDKYIIDKKLFIFNQKIKIMYNSIRENPNCLNIMLPNIVELIDSYLKPSTTEKKMLGEVFTNLKLVEEMLDKLPKEVWNNPDLKWLDPANGIGNFPVIVVKNLMDGLKEWQPDSELRLKHILENMIYVCDISSKNMFIYLQLFDPENKYKMNFYRGSFLEKEFDFYMKDVWKLDKFDIIVGNPPYQEKVGPSKTKSIWNFFVKKSISLLSKNGYLNMVHPSGWRSLDGDYKDIQNLIKGNLLYLEMNDDKKGQQVFNATTSFDYYCYSKKATIFTKVKDQNGNFFKLDLKKWEFIPNGEFELFQKLIAIDNEDRVEIIHSFSSYETRKPHVSKEKSNIFKYPCVYTITKDRSINLFWSNTNKNGHFGIPKIIWSNGMASPPTIDTDGEYGLTQFAYAIVDDIDNLQNIKDCMESNRFIEIMKLCYMSSGNRFDKKVLSTFKKDFWKKFV